MPAASRLVGRAAELAAVDELLTELERGTPRALEILGPAGIGKSRLLAELGARADARGHVVLSGAGAELEQDLPFWVFVDALDPYVAAIEPRRLERLDPIVRAELGDVLPSLAQAGDAARGALHERHRVHRAMRELLEQLAATKPLVVVLDDFHWADPASTDLLVALLHRPPAAGVLLAVAARPRQLPARLASALDRAHRAGTLERFELAPLTAEEARELVGAGADALYAEAGGNPFYLEQLARVGGRGADRSPANAVEVGGVDVPPMVAAALAEDLRLLPAAARRVLDGASVAGDPFDVDLAAAAADLPEPDVLDAVDELGAADFVRPTDVPRRFRFRHPIVRRAVYEATPGGWRIAAHARLARALAERGATATARAHHVERSARPGDLDAVTILRQAGDESRARAPATAARWYEAALRLLPASAGSGERVALLLPAAQALTATGRFARAHELLLEALEIAPPDAIGTRTELAASCARVEHLLGRHEDAHDRLVAALEQLPDEVSVEGVSLMVELTIDGTHRMNYPAMHAWGRRAAEAARRLDDDGVRAVALAAATRGAAVPGATAEAEALHAEAAALVDGLSDAELARRLDAAAYLSGAELYLHRFAEARRHAERVLRVSRATGQGQQLPHVFATFGTCWHLAGRFAEAVEPLDGAVEAARLTGNAQALGWSLYARSRIALALGDLDVALSTAQEAFDVTDDGAPSHHHSHAAFALAEAWLELGKPQRAAELLEACAGGPEMPMAAAAFRSLFLEPLVRARLELGDVAGAQRAARAAGESADAVGMPLAGAWADRARAELALATGDAAEAATVGLRAGDVFAGADAPVEAARAWTIAGRALAEAGERERARELLQRAADVFQERGAVRHRDRAERELRRLGHRVHRRSAPASAGTGVAALTKRELEIARLIVDRRTNRQIAEALFLSPKTVETHIRNIFAKLGADSRVEVARLVERADRMAEAG
ncbi:MAG TPA: AAA family ATPase [Capillimicrobium sp.]|nr:AAA family ATPase [Capillimicrobium sp.]